MYFSEYLAFIYLKFIFCSGSKLADRSFENVAKSRYFGMTVTYQNLMNEEIKSRRSSGSTCYHSVQNLLFSRLPIKLKIKIYRSISLSVPMTVATCSNS
jgi:hypothetical protein